MRLFQDIDSAKWLYAKGGLFLLLAFLAAGMLIARAPGVDVVVLLAICIWASCRAYYFAFYVIENYVDPGFRFTGLVDLLRYLLFGRDGGNE